MKKSERIAILETKVAELEQSLYELRFPNTARFDAETNAEADRIMAEIKRKATPVLTPNQQRADVIKRAKAFVAKWVRRAGSITREDGNSDMMNRGSLNTEFIVNADKRTVVCLAKSRTYGDLRGKGIAKCDPSDVFNSDIGKAIALARALGVEVPQEFVKAVQPTEVVVGHALYALDTGGIRFDYPRVTRVSEGKAYNDEGCFVRLNAAEYHGRLATNPVITDDTEAVYE